MPDRLRNVAQKLDSELATRQTLVASPTMPLPKRQTFAKASQRPRVQDPETQTTSDDRFANFETDPKFRLPSKKRAKTKLDPRFSRLRTDPDFQNKAPVDRYGRRVTTEEVKKNLGRLYGSDDEASDASGHDEDEQLNTAKAQRRDQAVRKELAKAQKRGLDPIRDGGLSSSSEESSDDDDEHEEEIEDQTDLAGEGNQVPTGDVTARLAAVNMDWDNIRATDIMAVANSFLPVDGRIRNVVIYPSDFGLERMQREEIEGPPKEIFAAEADAKKKNITDATQLAEDADSGKEDLANGDEGEDFDSKALRTYQLDRLRYYYAVITCSSANAAKAIYDNLDGREYLSSANFFDLRFVPEGVDFDAEPHDQCDDLPNGYKPKDFITGALSHSKVKLTWDADDTTRKEAQKRAFSRKEIDENELQAYLGADSSSSEDEAATAKADKAASLRAALGLGPSGAGKSSSKSKSSSKRDRDFKKPEGEMEVTFTSGLSNSGTKGSVFENEPEENTLEKYVRRQKERKERRKERYKATQEGRDPDAVTATSRKTTENEDENNDKEDEDPWNDPFFASDPEDVPRKPSSSKKSKRPTDIAAEKERADKERANLELLMLDDDDTNAHGPSSFNAPKMQHFDMNEIVKAEKNSSKKKRNKFAAKKAEKAAATQVQDSFEMNTQDPRFAKLFESHEFAIDPTNPRFKATKGMKALLEEGRKKRKHGGGAIDEGEGEGEGMSTGKRKKKKGSAGVAVDDDADGDSLKKLTERVKAKSLLRR
ncbi:unnamed protein product [Periconia digitata]|uniref:NUC153 domain-containing protein n=1 Tax=Periconia digitata TaxID=1303443 RepID=A0A9W4UVA1_9PLEO|nr:unnamed protein product [Periconia digitata]